MDEPKQQSQDVVSRILTLPQETAQAEVLNSSSKQEEYEEKIGPPEHERRVDSDIVDGQDKDSLTKNDDASE